MMTLIFCDEFSVSDHAITCNNQVIKVKAHQNLQNISDNLQLYHALGNCMVDEMASYACENLLPEAVLQLNEFHTDICEQRSKVVQYFQLNLDLQHARAQATGDVGDLDVGPVLPTGDTQNLLCNWTVLNPWTPAEILGDEELHNTAWGTQWAVVLLEWILKCKWPAEPVDNDPGISWVEIACSLAIQQGQWLPVKRERFGATYIFQPSRPEDMDTLQITLTEQATSAYSMLVQMQSLIVAPILPSQCKPGKVKSLYMQGHHAWTTGLSMRPQQPNQQKLYHLIRQHFTARTNAMNTLPFVDLDFTLEEWPEDVDRRLMTMDEKVKSAKAAMRRVRIRRVSQ